MKRRDFVGALGAGILLRTASLPNVDGERLVERWSWAMGQAVHLQLFAISEDAGLEAAALALAELRRVERALSLFDSTSDLVAINDRAGAGPVTVGPDLIQVLRDAEQLRRTTDGAFNVAVEPLMRAWGFREPRVEPPSPHELAQATEAIAATRLEFPTTASIALYPKTARLDLGGIGVGYGLDRAAAVLRARGIRRALLDVSGDLIALGRPFGAQGWPVEIRASPGGPSLATIPLRNAALATSANSVAVIHYQRQVVGHVLDPRSGTDAHAFRQATAVAPTGLLADAGAKAILINGRSIAGVAAASLVENDA